MVADGTIPPRTDPASVSEQDQPSFAEVGQNLAVAWTALGQYFAAQAARFRVLLRNFLLLTALGILAGFVALTVLISSTVLLVVGAADAIASLLGGRQWAGDLIVGLLVLGGVALAGVIVVRSIVRAKTANETAQTIVELIRKIMANPKTTETESLRQAAEDAKTRMKESLVRAKDALTQKIDPRELTRRHPWVAIGAAAAAGFSAIVVTVPTKQERELRRLERLREAMSPPPPPKPAEANGAHAKVVEKPSWASVILKELIQLVRPILMAAITAGMKAGANPPPPPETEPEGPDNSAPAP